MDRNARNLKKSKSKSDISKKYQDPIGLDVNLNPIKITYKYNSNNEIIL